MSIYIEPRKYDLSLIIPGNREMFHAKTIEDALEHSEAKTEVIAVLDGGVWANPPIAHHPDVRVVYLPTVHGQRGATNAGARLSKARYIAKSDAHCTFGQGWDRLMLEAFAKVGDDVTMVPIMRNLHAFNWVCKDCNWTKYQGPTPEQCENCHKVGTVFRDMVWQPRRGTYSQSYCFDAEPHFQYFQEYKRRPEYNAGKAIDGLTETMSLQGSFFMSSLENYWKLKLSDERVGSWGNQGIEVACKTWLSGGRVLVNHNTWYAHLFRTQGGDFSFPYHNSQSGIDKTKQRVWEMFFDGSFKHQIYPVSWLVRRFSPVPGWDDNALRLLEEKEKMGV